MELKDKHQAHGITIGGMQELRNKRSQGIENLIDANNATEINNKLFVEFEGHKIKEVEKGHYHIAMEMPSYHRTTGQKLSSPRVNRYTVQAYEANKKNRGFNGYEMHILHDPTKVNAPAGKPVESGLTTIQGIGKAMQEKLNSVGILTIQDLADLDEEKIIKLVADGTFGEVELRSWVDQAKTN